MRYASPIYVDILNLTPEQKEYAMMHHSDYGIPEDLEAHHSKRVNRLHYQPTLAEIARAAERRQNNRDTWCVIIVCCIVASAIAYIIH